MDIWASDSLLAFSPKLIIYRAIALSFVGFVYVVICQGCHNEVHRLGGLKNKISFITFMEARN